MNLRHSKGTLNLECPHFLSDFKSIELLGVKDPSSQTFQADYLNIKAITLNMNPEITGVFVQKLLCRQNKIVRAIFHINAETFITPGRFDRQKYDPLVKLQKKHTLDALSTILGCCKHVDLLLLLICQVEPPL